MVGSRSQYCEIHQHLEDSSENGNEVISGPSPTQQDLNVKTRRAAETLLKNKLIEESTVTPPDWDGCRDLTKIPKVYNVIIISVKDSISFLSFNRKLQELSVSADHVAAVWGPQICTHTKVHPR